MAAKIPAYIGDIIHSCADEYGAIAVVEEATSRTLHFGSTARQSTMYLNNPVRLALSYTRCMLGGLLFAPPPRRALVLGLGGGSLPKFLLHHYGECRVEVVEMRPLVAETARNYFALPENDRLTLHLQKAESFLARDDVGPYDWIFVDLHNSDGMAPVLDQADFFARCQRLLEPSGMLSANLWTGDQADFLARIGARLHQSFKEQVLFLPVARKRNTVALAFNFALPSLDVQPKRQYADELQMRYDIEFVDFLWDILRYNRNLQKS
ncbi:MAG: spermine/spermidine synthase domain-containing protein [Candidatus Latescibacterota bacterium]